MRLTLPSCDHRKVAWRGLLYGTCLSCYQRIVIRNGEPVPDTAPGVCHHSELTPIEALNKKPYQDALCNDCGRVLRHPDAPGKWTDVIDYSFHIVEAP